MLCCVFSHRVTRLQSRLWGPVQVCKVQSFWRKYIFALLCGAFLHRAPASGSARREACINRACAGDGAGSVGQALLHALCPEPAGAGRRPLLAGCRCQGWPALFFILCLSARSERLTGHARGAGRRSRGWPCRTGTPTCSPAASTKWSSAGTWSTTRHAPATPTLTLRGYVTLGPERMKYDKARLFAPEDYVMSVCTCAARCGSGGRRSIASNTSLCCYRSCCLRGCCSCNCLQVQEYFTEGLTV